MTTMQADVAKLQAAITKHDHSEKGNVLVEFAIILPIFLMLLFGVIYFSVALYDKTVLTIATREGARAGVKFVANGANTITSRATTATLLVCQNNLISFGPSMTCNVPTPTIQNNILTVTANVNYTGFYIFPDFSISAQTSMRLEQ